MSQERQEETQVQGHLGLSHVLLCPSHNVLCMHRSSAWPFPPIQMGSVSKIRCQEEHRHCALCPQLLGSPSG